MAETAYERFLKDPDKNEAVDIEIKNQKPLDLDQVKFKIQEELTSSFASGGRAGYALGEMVEEQVTETMDQGPMAQSDNPISYDQLRARLPAEITDDIVELMANSAEALEDFAMISSQQDVDLFNQKYSVNLVLPSEA